MICFIVFPFSGWHHQHQISGRFNGWGQGYIWKSDCHRRTHSAPLWEARCLPCECEGWKFCWTRPSHPLHSGHRSVKSSDLSENELKSKAIASNFGTKWLVIYNTVRLKRFYWIIINNHKKSEIRFQYGCSLFTKLCTYLTPYMLFYLNIGFKNTETLFFFFFLYWNAQFVSVFSSSSTGCPSGGGPNRWQKSRSKSHSYSAAHWGKPYRVLLVDWR